jgi:hypothetical protein
MGGDSPIIVISLSPQALDVTQRYSTWGDDFDEAFQTIAADPYPPGWDKIPETTLKPEQYAGCIIRDISPFQYVYQFDAPDEIVILIITLCFPYSVTM